MSVHESLPAGCEPACPGCRHRTLTAAASLAQKSAYLERVLVRWAGRLQPIRAVPAAARLGYRDRVTLNAAWDATTGWQFGLMRRDELIPIPRCPVHTDRVNRFVALLHSALPPASKFPLAYVHVAGAQATLIVKARRFESVDLVRLLDDLGQIGLEGCWVHCHPSAGRNLFARSGWHLAWGQAQSMGSDGLRHGPTSFQQLLPRLHAVAIELALAYLAPDSETAVLDLYCGIGATLRSWVGPAAAVLGVELAGGAVTAAGCNVPAAQVLRGTCVQRLPQIRDWWHAHAGRHVAYVNPPRSGLEPELCAALSTELRPDRLAYLSCSGGTLARDIGEFENAGYAVDALVPFDFFPLTQHVECMAMLGRQQLPGSGG